MREIDLAVSGDGAAASRQFAARVFALSSDYFLITGGLASLTRFVTHYYPWKSLKPAGNFSYDMMLRCSGDLAIPLRTLEPSRQVVP
jgi:hypothetical protein